MSILRITMMDVKRMRRARAGIFENPRENQHGLSLAAQLAKEEKRVWLGYTVQQEDCAKHLTLWSQVPPQ